MLSESTRMCTAAEAAFRVQYPNSKARRSVVIVLDADSRHVLDEAADLPWNGARFFTLARTEPLSQALGQIVVDVVLTGQDGTESRLSEEVTNADVVVMIASAGHAAESAAAIGNICFVRNVMTTGLILREKHENADNSVTLKNMRPYAAMLVVASGDDYIPAMLSALRA